MADLHPFFVHFPIALLLAAVCFDIHGVARDFRTSMMTAYVLQVVAALFAILAALSGNLAESTIEQDEALSAGISAALNNHISFGNTIVWIIVIVTLGRTFALLEKKVWARSGWIFPVLSLGLAILVLITGFLGGDLSQAILQYFINS